MITEYGSRFSLTHDGARLWWSRFGTEGGVPIVLCDGVGCDGFIWKFLAPHLAQRHPILRFHYRGHGQSGLAFDPESMGVEIFADDLAMLMDEAGMKEAVVFGHSMGVQVQLEFQRRHPAKVRGLVTLCGSYGHVLDTFHNDTMVKRLLPRAKALVEKFPGVAQTLWSAAIPTELGLVIARYVESKPWLLAREDMWPYLQHMAKLDPRVFLRSLAAASEHTAWEHLPDIHVPTLVVAGQADTFTPAWVSERMADAIPNAELLVMRAATHTAPLEMPELLALRVDKFLKDHFAAPASLPGPVAAAATATEARPAAAG
jgi:pimeloyl-ACP methyl ester carboxylesterase